jgi:iron complex transport system substrate-binding protein
MAGLLRLAGLLLLAGAACLAQPARSNAQPAAARPARIVSLVPAVTEMLFAIGAGPQVAAVSSFDRFPPAVERLPRVGALLDPDTERILSLRPNLVVVYGSQAELLEQFKRAGISTFAYRHGGLADTLDTIGAVGRAAGHGDIAAKVVASLRARLEDIRRRTAGRTRPRTLLVISREPGTLRGLYASGGSGFLHDVLELAGGANVFADVREESVQPSHETLITRRPETVVELHPETEVADPAEARRAWSALAAIPAVRGNRVHVLAGAYLAVAGPRLGETAESIGRALHPDAFK